jgi:hypothetical protein
MRSNGSRNTVKVRASPRTATGVSNPEMPTHELRAERALDLVLVDRSINAIIDQHDTPRTARSIVLLKIKLTELPAHFGM